MIKKIFTSLFTNSYARFYDVLKEVLSDLSILVICFPYVINKCDMILRDHVTIMVISNYLSCSFSINQ